VNFQLSHNTVIISGIHIQNLFNVSLWTVWGTWYS